MHLDTRHLDRRRACASPATGRFARQPGAAPADLYGSPASENVLTLHTNAYVSTVGQYLGPQMRSGFASPLSCAGAAPRADAPTGARRCKSSARTGLAAVPFLFLTYHDPECSSGPLLVTSRARRYVSQWRVPIFGVEVQECHASRMRRQRNAPVTDGCVKGSRSTAGLQANLPNQPESRAMLC